MVRQTIGTERDLQEIGADFHVTVDEEESVTLGHGSTRVAGNGGVGVAGQMDDGHVLAQAFADTLRRAVRGL